MESAVSAEFETLVSDEDYRKIDKDESYSLLNYRHAAHCMIYAPWSVKNADGCDTRAAVLMQLRSDGYLGFPGGMHDACDASTAVALDRELAEEVGLDIGQLSVQDERHHLFSHLCKRSNIALHFYAIQITLEELRNIERKALDAPHFGYEVLGMIRVPLFTTPDGHGGLPAFLKNNFAGNAREQLLLALVHTGLMSHDDVLRAMQTSVEVPQQ